MQQLRQVFEVLREQKLFANIKRCHFLDDHFIFLGYLVSKTGIWMDPAKFESILSWETSGSFQEVRSFHGLISFYGRFV